jgi:hypothetical protein
VAVDADRMEEQTGEGRRQNGVGEWKRSGEARFRWSGRRMVAKKANKAWRSRSGRAR